MRRYITLLTFTPQGASTIQDSPNRADAFTRTATAVGAKINALYWTTGGFDGVLSFDAPDDETAAALMVKLTSAGNVQTQTLQAFPREGIERILGKVSGM
ncbi:MAG: hypothetical protein ACI9R3_001683 [Verrucomicrobiales bacterium]|jgi:uncharacterized protein with GYD domain